MSTRNAVYLGTTKPAFGRPERIYLFDFEWQCGWYWAGGYLGNNNSHFHFNGAFLEAPDIRGHSLGNFVTPWTISPEYSKDNRVVLSNGCAIWEDLSTFLDNPAFDASTWWRVKDLFKQFYAIKEAAEVFKYGGYCASAGRNPLEINLDLARTMNAHLRDVIIPEIRKVTGLDKMPMPKSF